MSRYNSIADNYGDWEVLPVDWHNSHNLTVGWNNPYGNASGTCVWETGRTGNSSADGCTAAQHGVMRRFQEEFSAAVGLSSALHAPYFAYKALSHKVTLYIQHKIIIRTLCIILV